jgi:endonuclease/exonuclease/phosphatase family metal-dependent hydrolase
MLKILTYNAGLLKIGLFGRTLVEPAPFVNERFARLAPALLSSGADIIALQEVYDRSHQTQLINDLFGIYPYHAVSPTRRWRHFGAALMIFSKYPMVDVQYLLFDHVPFDERLFVDKGIIIATINTDVFGPIRLANTHNTSGGALHDPEGVFTSRVRDNQYRQIFAALDHDPSMKRFAVGDFNASPEVMPKNYQELLSHGYTDAWASCHSVTNDSTWDPKNELNAHGPHRLTSAQRMDHIFSKNGSGSAIWAIDARIVLNDRCVSVPGGGRVTISDHYGLIVGLETDDGTIHGKIN